MEKFIGVKMVEAAPMLSLVPMGEHEKGSDGYRVRYSNNYESWCPKDVFEGNNLKIRGVNNTIHESDVLDMVAHTEANTLDSGFNETKTTIVIVTLRNGFTLTETSSCVDPKNYDEEVGKQICLRKIHDKIWFLLGFLLQSGVDGFNKIK